MSKRDQDLKKHAKLAKQRLKQVVSDFKKQKPVHQFRQNPKAVRLQLRRDPALVEALFELANRDLVEFNKLLNTYETHILKNIQQEQPLGPTDPRVINNPNHPLNPASPTATRLNLLINAPLNPLFREFLNGQAEGFESQAELKAERKQYLNDEKIEDRQEDQLMNDIFKEASLTSAAEQAKIADPKLNPYQVLGLNKQKEFSQKELQAAVLCELAEHASEPKHHPSPSFGKYAAAGLMLLAETHGLSAFENTPSPTPTAPAA